MAKKGGRPRAARRLLERGLAKEVRERERLVVLGPGGAPERPISVETPAVIEGTARSTPCHQCGGELAVDDHTIDRHGDDLLRLVHATCRRCSAKRRIWFRLTPKAVH